MANGQMILEESESKHLAVEGVQLRPVECVYDGITSHVVLVVRVWSGLAVVGGAR